MIQKHSEAKSVESIIFLLLGFFDYVRSFLFESFQVEKVLTGYPAHYGGLLPHDFLVSVQGQVGAPRI
jgi:hypothetical protein